MFNVKWSTLAEITFADEIDFIVRKWNLVQANEFILLVYDCLNRLANNPALGIYNSKFNCFSVIISRQTTFYFRILESEKELALVLFWNYKQNPNHLNNLLL